MMKRIALLLLLTLFVPVSPSHAAIHLENRDLFLEFEDLDFPPDIPRGGLVLQRVYNSKDAVHRLVRPWLGSTLEVRLTTYPDGSVIIQEFGGGAEILFESQNSKAALENSIQALAQWATKRGNFGTSEQKRQYIQKARTNASFRQQEFRIALGSKKIQVPPIATGTQFISAQFQYQYLTKTDTGFTRRLEDGTYQVFNQDGQVVTLQRNGRSWQIEYNAHGLISSVVSPDNKRLRFQFNRLGFLENIANEDGTSVAYSYSDAHDLIGVQYSSGKKFAYRYDPNRRHLLMEADYPDKTRVIARYEDYQHGEDLKYYQERNGTVTELKTVKDPTDPLHLTFEITEKTSDGVPAKTVIEYFDRTKANGQRWTYRRVQSQGTSRVETNYNESCEKPALITETSGRTEFAYDQYCRTSRWSFSSGKHTSVVDYSYYRASNRLTLYQKKDTPGESLSWAFVYDATGRLIGAKDSSGSSFILFYGSDGRLMRVTRGANEAINVNISEQPPQVTLQNSQLGAWTIPSKAEPTPNQRSLIDAWDKLNDLIRRSNNPPPL